MWQAVGGLCLPESCSVSVVAQYLAPRVVPWPLGPSMEESGCRQAAGLPLAGHFKLLKQDFETL